MSELEAPKLCVFLGGQLLMETLIDQPLELGRQRQSEPAPPFRGPPADGTGPLRVLIAASSESKVSREHLLLEPEEEGTVKVTNLSNKRGVSVEPGEQLRGSESCQVAADCRIQLPPVMLRIEFPETPRGRFTVLRTATRAPNVLSGPVDLPADGTLMQSMKAVDSHHLPVLLNWLQSMATVLQNVASSPHFLPEAAQLVTEIVGLEHAVVLRRDDDGGWIMQAEHGAYVGQSHPVSQRILNKMAAEKRTLRWSPEQSTIGGKSLEQVDNVVAAPILDELSEVVGAVYATRRQSAVNESASNVTDLEASLVELIAVGIAAGWARLHYEQQAMKSRIQFEQFFGADLAARLESDPQLLEGRDALITVMFCDISGFSSISERLPTDVILSWINSVMGAMSDCVIAHRGVLVDYIGDELFAMWGAPFKIADHASRACHAALAIGQRVAELSEQWRPQLGSPFDVRIGINTGPARVGNVGSSLKFKYGPLGNSVNVGSRVQGAAKQVGSRLLATESTIRLLPSGFAIRKLCQVRTVNIDEPIAVFEFAFQPTPQWQAAASLHRRALQQYESGDLTGAESTLTDLLANQPDDGPAEKLLQRVRGARTDSSLAEVIWNLDRK